MSEILTSTLNVPEEGDETYQDCGKSKSTPTCQRSFKKHLKMLFSPTDHNSSILPLHYVSKALGLTCFTVNIDNGQVNYRSSTRGLVYTLLVFSLLISLCVYVNVYMFDYEEFATLSYSCLMMTNDVFQSNASIILALATLLSGLHQKKHILCLINLKNVDVILTKFNVNIPIQRNQRFLVIQVVSGMILIILLVFSDWILIMNSKTEIDAIESVAYVLPKLMNYASECQFLAWAWSLRQRHRLLNGRLESGQVDATLVPALSAAHASLCGIADDVNDLFSLQLLVRIGFYFVEILTNMFFAVQIVPHLVERDFVPSYFVINSFYWTLWVTIELVLICSACYSLTKEASRTGIIVHAILREPNSICVKEQLQMFSSQLLHQRVSFTACGLFVIDLQLVHAVFGTVTTYLVILVQFNSDFVKLTMNKQNTTR